VKVQLRKRSTETQVEAQGKRERNHEVGSLCVVLVSRMRINIRLSSTQLDLDAFHLSVGSTDKRSQEQINGSVAMHFHLLRKDSIGGHCETRIYLHFDNNNVIGTKNGCENAIR
jgi:hypothetical protein